MVFYSSVLENEKRKPKAIVANVECLGLKNYSVGVYGLLLYVQIATDSEGMVALNGTDEDEEYEIDEENVVIVQIKKRGEIHPTPLVARESCYFMGLGFPSTKIKIIENNIKEIKKNLSHISYLLTKNNISNDEFLNNIQTAFTGYI